MEWVRGSHPCILVNREYTQDVACSPNAWSSCVHLLPLTCLLVTHSTIHVFALSSLKGMHVQLFCVWDVCVRRPCLDNPYLGVLCVQDSCMWPLGTLTSPARTWAILYNSASSLHVLSMCEGYCVKEKAQTPL